jgi:hypothetical protein
MMKHESKVGNIPAGGIIRWSGAIVDIPGGFVICDGNNGTPDLRNFFVPGAGDTYAPGDTGGTVDHTHTGDPSHTHVVPSGAQILTGKNFSATTGAPAAPGVTGTAGTLPPWYALAYVMKT